MVGQKGLQDRSFLRIAVAAPLGALQRERHFRRRAVICSSTVDLYLPKDMRSGATADATQLVDRELRRNMLAFYYRYAMQM
jgi:hypothetical protein